MPLPIFLKGQTVKFRSSRNYLYPNRIIKVPKDHLLTIETIGVDTNGNTAIKFTESDILCISEEELIAVTYPRTLTDEEIKEWFGFLDENEEGDV